MTKMISSKSSAIIFVLMNASCKVCFNHPFQPNFYICFTFLSFLLFVSCLVIALLIHQEKKLAKWWWILLNGLKWLNQDRSTKPDSIFWYSFCCILLLVTRIHFCHIISYFSLLLRYFMLCLFIVYLLTFEIFILEWQ